MDLLKEYEDKKLKHIAVEVIRENGDIELQNKIALRNKDLLIIETPIDWSMEMIEQVSEIFTTALSEDKMQAIIVPEGLKFKVVSVREE